MRYSSGVGRLPWVFFAAMIRKGQRFNQTMLAVLDDGKPKRQIAVLDGIRALACLSVITWHTNLVFVANHIWNSDLSGVGSWISAISYFGESGPILFFVLSGFLLFLPFARALLFDQPWPLLPRFYIRRIFRILPAYYLALFLMLLFLFPDKLQPAHWSEIWLFLTFRMDQNGVFQQINAPFWTLASEFQFYLLLPLIAWVMRLVVRKGTLNGRMLKLTFCIFLMFAWGLCTRYWGLTIAGTNRLDAWVPRSLSDTLEPYVYAHSGKFFEVFAIGMFLCMLYVYAEYAPGNRMLRSRLCRLSPLLFVIGLGLLSFMALWHFYKIYAGWTLHFFDAYRPFLLGNWDLLQPICHAIGYGVCMYALLYGSVRFKRPFEWSVLRWIGMISYSLYMWHFQFIIHFWLSLLPRFQAAGWNKYAQYGITWMWIVLTVFPFSLVIYRYVEQPFIRYGEYLCRYWERRGRSIRTTVSSEVLVEVPMTRET